MKQDNIERRLEEYRRDFPDSGHSSLASHSIFGVPQFNDPHANVHWLSNLVLRLMNELEELEEDIEYKKVRDYIARLAGHSLSKAQVSHLKQIIKGR